MAHFNHAFSLGFSVISEKEDGSDLTDAGLLEAILVRLLDLHRNSTGGAFREAVEPGFDSYETTAKDEAWRQPLLAKARSILNHF